MWIRTQNGEELVEANRIKAIRLENGDVNIVAKLDREDVILGTYCKDQAKSELMSISLRLTENKLVIFMPKRREEEAE